MLYGNSYKLSVTPFVCNNYLKNLIGNWYRVLAEMSSYLAIYSWKKYRDICYILIIPLYFPVIVNIDFTQILNRFSIKMIY